MDKLSKQINDYLRYCEFEMGMTPQTLRSKRYILKSFRAVLKRSDASKITEADYSEWRRGCLEKGASPRTVNTRIAHTVAFFKYLQRKKTKLKIDVASIQPTKVRDVEVQFFKREQIEEVKNHCKGLRDYLLISIMFEAGLRIHEIAKLEVQHFTDNHIRLIGKGGKLRDTFVDANTRKVLIRWLALNDISEGYIFPSPVEYGKHLSIDSIRAITKLAFQRAGIENFNPHALRHSFATNLITNKAPLPFVQALMGHSDPKTTAKYVHLATDDLQKAHEQYSKA